MYVCMHAQVCSYVYERNKVHVPCIRKYLCACMYIQILYTLTLERIYDALFKHVENIYDVTMSVCFHCHAACTNHSHSHLYPRISIA